jgi:rhodanese-related sulfurtransferase
MPEGLEVSTEETARALSEKSARVVDVREPYEREAGHVEGTDHVALNELSQAAADFDPAQPVIFYCRSGGRSLMAAQALRGAGFDAYSMAGGLQRWADEDRPLSPEDGHVADH